MMLAKVCIIGETSVGKTSLIRRFVDRSFDDAYLTTVGVKISRKHLPVPAHDPADNGGIQLVLWDLEGGEPFGDTSSAHLKGARAAIIVGDVTRPGTIEALEQHAQRFLRINPKGAIVLVLNKSDLDHDQGMLVPAALHALDPVISTFRTSARTGEGVDEVFTTLGKHLLRGESDARPA